jgi:hypothetical protein
MYEENGFAEGKLFTLLDGKTDMTCRASEHYASKKGKKCK